MLAVTNQQEELTLRHKMPYTRQFAHVIAHFAGDWATKVAIEEVQEFRLPPPNPTRQEQRAAKAGVTDERAESASRRKRSRARTAAERAEAEATAQRKQVRAEARRQEAAQASTARNAETQAEAERIAR